MRRFLSPGWLIGLLAVVLFAYACFTLLAPWQLGKSEDLDARNERLTESVQAAPAPLEQVVDDPTDFVESEWRLVTVSGTWDPAAEALLRLRSVDGELVYQVFTVFQPDAAREILVNRGYVPVGENNTVPDYPPAPGGPVEITSRVRAAEPGKAEPVLVDGRQTVRVVDPVVLGETLDHRLVPDGYLQLAAEEPGSLGPAPVPGIENGPYFSYGLQWAAFGILAPIGLAYFAWSEIRTRRRGDTGPSVDGGAAGAAPPPSVEPGSSPAPAEHDDRERVMMSRYGERYDAEHRRAWKHADRLRL